MDEAIACKGRRLSSQVVIISAFIFVTQVINGFYALYDMTPPGAFVLMNIFGLLWLVGDWLKKDCKKHNIEWVFDMGFFLYIFWPILIPFYLFKTRGIKNAVITTSSFVCLYFGSFALGLFGTDFLMP